MKNTERVPEKSFNGGWTARLIMIVWLAAFGLLMASSLLSGAEKTLILQAEDGSIQLQARAAQVHGTTVRYEPQPHKNTIGYWTKAEDWVSWDLEVNQPGTFSVTVNQACGKGSGGSQYRLSVGDQELIDIVPDTGAFTNFVQRTIGSVTLAKAGTYTLSVKPLKKPGLAVMDLRAVSLKMKK